MKYEIVWREIQEREHTVEAGSFEEAISTLLEDWDDGKFETESADLYNEFICNATGEQALQWNGYW